MYPISSLDLPGPGSTSIDERYWSHLYGARVRPDLRNLMDLLRIDVRYHRASGPYVYFTRDNVEHQVLDLIGSYGASFFGHNPERLKRRAFELIGNDVPVFVQGAIKTYASELSELINQQCAKIGWTSRYYQHLFSTGAEAVESALAYADAIWRKKRQLYTEQKARAEDLPDTPVFIAVKNGFHGKTKGALNVTSALASSLIPLPPKSDVVILDAAGGVAEMREQVAQYFGPRFSSIAGIIWEPIQVEGGVSEVSSEFMEFLKYLRTTFDVPLIVDEIQTGCFRTGDFLANRQIEPDFLLLGKSLGGGMAKISACMIRDSRYLTNIGIFRSSTFAEDEYSSAMALESMMLGIESLGDIRERSLNFETAIKQSVAKLQQKYPGVLVDCRGRGFLLGIEFNIDLERSVANFFKAVVQSGFVGHFFASYFLNHHDIRIAPCLSRPNILRLEPCWQISDADIQKFLSALESLVDKLACGRFLAISSHLWRKDDRYKESLVVSERAAAALQTNLEPTYFLSHLIDTEHVQNLDALFATISEDELQMFLDRFSPIAGDFRYHEQIIAGSNGKQIHFVLQGISSHSKFFEQSLLARDREAFSKVKRATLEIAARGGKYIGLGQYTSIVSHNGLKLPTLPNTYYTTGNGLTVGLAYQSLMRLVNDQGWDSRRLDIAVVGAMGNIGQVFSQLCARQFQRLFLVGRTLVASDGRVSEFQKSLERDAADVVITNDIQQINRCDIVVIATNTISKFVSIDALKRGAIVLDLSVPSNIDPASMRRRADVTCFLGGYAKLPLGQRLLTPLVPTPNGEIFGCMAETVMMALAGSEASSSLGALTVQHVESTLSLAESVGISLGSLKLVNGF